MSPDKNLYLFAFLKILERLPITLAIMFLSLAFGIFLGLIIAIIRIRKRKMSYFFATLYLSFIRCTPVLVQLFLVFYGLPQLLLLIGIDINKWNAVIFAVFAFSLHSSALLSEIIRSAYLSVGLAQQEAAYSVGMTYWQSLKRIILPQAFRVALPNLGNDLIMLLKETSLAFTIGVTDIMGQVTVILYNNYGTNVFELYLLISLIYWIICIIIESGVHYLEKISAKGYVKLVKKEV